MQGMAARDRDALIAALRTDYRTAPLGEPERAMLDYAVKLTRTPAAVTADDVARLRALGLDDRAIHDLCAVAAYYAFVNRIADGLGVELEPHLVP
jgi:uncharacterized peroxidase-related enzyme